MNDTTMLTRPARIFDGRSYGLVGGINDDEHAALDWAAIQAAIDAAAAWAESSKGAAIAYIPQCVTGTGIYYLDKPLRVGTNYVMILGDGGKGKQTILRARFVGGCVIFSRRMRRCPATWTGPFREPRPWT